MDESTDPNIVLYVAYEKEVKVIERETIRRPGVNGWTFEYIDTPETKAELEKLQDDGWEVDLTVGDVRKYVLVRDIE